MLDEPAGLLKKELNISRVRTLHKWLSYNRFTIFGFGGGLFVPWEFVLIVMTVLAVAFVPYMLYVLFKNRKYGWLIFFVISVGIPIFLAFIHTGNSILDTGLHFLPLLTFFFYCLILRYSVEDWIGEADMARAFRVEDQNK